MCGQEKMTLEAGSEVSWLEGGGRTGFSVWSCNHTDMARARRDVEDGIGPVASGSGRAIHAWVGFMGCLLKLELENRRISPVTTSRFEVRWDGIAVGTGTGSGHLLLPKPCHPSLIDGDFPRTWLWQSFLLSLWQVWCLARDGRHERHASAF
jgi:hypothetical protein